MRKIVYLPVDERPCNFNYTLTVSKSFNDIEFIQVPKKLMGDFRVPADFEKIKDFLLTNCKNADVLVIGLEALLYGGLVPSRNHNLEKEEILDRLKLLKELKQNNSKLKIYGFSLIMRCPCYNGSDEEPAYFFDHGKDIFNYGVLIDKHQRGLIDDNAFKKQTNFYLEKYSKEIEDYVSRRKINNEILKETLKLVGNTIDFFVIPQDDSSEFGFTAIDKREIFDFVKNSNLNIPIYCGCDEVGMVLIGRAICDLKNTKIKVKCVFPKPECEDIWPIYEGSSLRDTLKSQLEVAGYERVENNEDVVMYLNYPTKEIVNMGNKPSSGYELRDMKSFNSKIISDVNNGALVLLCDGAYGNGGEKEWLIDLEKSISLFDVTAYAGWNTSSNTLGTVLFQGISYFFYRNKTVNDDFLADRIVEDIGYCGAVRWDVWHNDVEKLGYSYYTTGEKNGVVAKLTKKKLENFIESNFPEVFKKYEIIKCEMPWRRLFEVDVKTMKK